MSLREPRTERSFCRICQGHCGVVADIDATDRVTAIRGDRDDPQSMGFICSKGTTSPDAHVDPGRLLHPLKRLPDGSFTQIPLGQALDEIAAALSVILERDGPDAIAGYRGTGGFFTTLGLSMLPAWLQALGSHKLFSTLTIDQSAKVVTAYRMGVWPPGPHTFQTSDVSLLVGSNPLVSVASLDTRHPLKRLKEARASGLKLIVIDPRRTETARLADIFIQPLPGQDAAILASLLRIILDEGWHDAAFCAQHVGDLDRLRAAVEPFEASAVARRADVPASLLRDAAEAFARHGRRGTVRSGTGLDMGPHSNLAEQLVECLNVVCGRLVRAGERVWNQGLLVGRGPRPAQVVNLPRPWEQGPRSRIGAFGLIAGEMATGTLSEDILRPGPGRIRFLLNHGGNPATAVPDQRRMVAALRDLDLLVSIEPVMSATARLSHYILPPTLQYERPDLPIYLFESGLFPTPYTRYTPALVEPPAGSDLCDEWRVMYALAQRLGRPLDYMGVPLDMTAAPSEDALFDIVLGQAPVDLAELKRHPLGYFHDDDIHALPADPATAGRFTTMPDDVQAEMAAMTAEWAASTGRETGFRLICRRSRHRMNSIGSTLPELRRLMPNNRGNMNPGDMARLGIASGDWIEVASETGRLRTCADADESIRSGVISMSHGFGGLPEDDDFLGQGVATNLLLSTDRNLQTINAMPLMSGIPVTIRPIDPPTANGPAVAARADANPAMMPSQN